MFDYLIDTVPGSVLSRKNPRNPPINMFVPSSALSIWSNSELPKINKLDKKW